MKKNIYKEIPENFHRQFCQTLTELEDSPNHRPSQDSTLLRGLPLCPKKPRRRKYGILLAAAILACACVTVAAAGLMEWHERMSTRFGTDKDLEDKLSASQVAVPQSAFVEKNSLKFQALQAVRTDSCDYFLLRMTLPEEIHWNEDIIFEDAQVIGQDFGCIPNFVNDSLKDHTVLLELQLFYPDDAAPAVNEIRIRLKNLIQAQKSDAPDYLVEGEWEIPLTLPPAKADTVRFYPGQTITLGEHEICFSQADVSPFQLRLYTEQDPALHAAWGHSIFLSGVCYQDGTVVEEKGLTFSLSGHSDESGNFCFEFPLENAVDTGQISGILINDCGEERTFSLSPMPEQAESEAPVRQTPEHSTLLPISGNGRSLSDLRLLYVKYDNVVLADEDSIYLWDTRCGRLKELFSLSEFNFSWENGGEVSLGQASQILLLPYAGSTDVYLYDIARKEMLTLDAAAFWPWPTHESYLANCKTITDLIPEADERYSRESFFSQGKWYYLYSEDGSVQNMELRSQGERNRGE